MISKDAVRQADSTTYIFGEFNLEAENLLLLRDSEIIPLAPKALEVLLALVESNGKLITKQQILDKVWANTFVEEANLTHHISSLRKALGEDKNGRKFIETIPRKGYRFVAAVSEQGNSVSEIVFTEKTSTRAIEEVEIETEETDTVQNAENQIALQNAPRILPKNLKIAAVATMFVLLLALSLFAVHEWRKNNARHSFDTLRSVKLTAWKSTRGNDYWDFKSSHNGNMMAYSSSKDGNPAIYVKQIGGGEDLRLTNDEWDNASPLWSPDDRQIMFASVRDNQAGIYSCASLGGAATLVKIIGEGTLSLRNWSSGAAIYYEFNGNLFKLNIDDKESAQITNFAPEKGINRYFRVSPDETRVSYSEKIGEKSNLQILEIASGNTRSLIDGADAIIESAWTPDGAGLFYQVQRDQIYQIFFTDSRGGEPVQITRGDRNVELIDVSPDGKRLFYYTSEDSSDIGGVNIETGEQFEVVSETESEFWAHISPDGKRVAYLSNSSQYAMPRLTDSSVIVRQIGEKSNPLVFQGVNQKWLPDNRRIAFLRVDEAAQIYNLWTFDATSGAEKRITADGITAPATATFPYNRAQTHDFSWSSDSRKVAYIGAKRQNVFLKTDESEPVNLTNNTNPNLNFHCPIWSPDGEKFAYVSVLKANSPNEKPQWNVWLYETGAAQKIFTTEQSLRFLGWTQTSEMLFEAADGALKSDPINIKLLQISASGANRVVNSFKMISAFSMTLSPDGKSIIFTKEASGKDDIYLAETTGGEAKKLTTNADSHTFFGSPAWLPDGKTVYFDKQERINTISMFENIK